VTPIHENLIRDLEELLFGVGEAADNVVALKR
jgi:hypothetical protein